MKAKNDSKVTQGAEKKGVDRDAVIKLARVLKASDSQPKVRDFSTSRELTNRCR